MDRDSRVGIAVDLAQTVVEADRVHCTRRGRAEAGDEARVRVPADVLVLVREREHAPVGGADDERRVGRGPFNCRCDRLLRALS